mgnify:CR=1 FL=1
MQYSRAGSKGHSETRSQKRQNRREHRLKSVSRPAHINSFSETSAEELKTLQKADPTVKALVEWLERRKVMMELHVLLSGGRVVGVVVHRVRK